MKLITTTYAVGTGWASPLPSDMDSANTLVLAFAAPQFRAHAEPFQALAAAFPQSVITGCSSSGEIAGMTVQDASVSVAIARFEHTRLRRAFAEISGPPDSYAAGTQLARELAGDDLRAVFVLSDGLLVNGSALVAGLTRHLPAGMIITGGMAADGGDFRHTWILDQGTPVTQRICAVGLYGDRLHVGHGCGGGWSDFGPERYISRSVNNVLYELDGKPALELYKTYLGELAQGLPGTALLFPLAVSYPGQDAPPLVRPILGVDEDDQSITFAGDIPQGGIARLMRATTDKLILGAGKAGREAAEGVSQVDDSLVISVSCIGRRMVLGERTDEELETVNEGAPKRSSQIGFYAYGEISPAVPGGMSALHNQTMTVTVLSEG